MESQDDDHEALPDAKYDLPPDTAAVGHPSTDPHMLDKALQGPNAKEWQEALEYEINQLQKLGTWVVEDLAKARQQYRAVRC